MELIAFEYSLQHLAIWLGLLLGALLVFDSIRQFLAGGHEVEIRNRRMRMVKKGVEAEQLFDALTRHEKFGQAETLSIFGWLRKLLRQANVTAPLSKVLLVPLVLSVLFYVVVALALDTPIAAFTALLIGFLIPFAILSAVAKSRMNALVGQLPEALDMMARGLRVGHPIAMSLQRVAHEMPDPIGSEFALIEDRVRHGAELTEAFAEFAERVDIEDARYLAASISIQHGTGGNLARVLAILSKVIRDRLLMKKKIVAISAEGRLSGTILSIMPFLIIGAIYSSSPGFYVDVMHHPIVTQVIVICCVLLFLQIVILRRLTNFDF